MLNLVVVFGASFFMTMLLGIQSKNVNQSRYVAAAITSLGISACQIIFAKAAVDGGWAQIAAMMIGGAAGIIFSIWIYDWITERALNKTQKQRIYEDDFIIG